MVGEADVTIRYAFLPTESSIRDGVNKLTKDVEKKLSKIKIGGTNGGVSGITDSFEKVSKKWINQPKK